MCSPLHERQLAAQSRPVPQAGACVLGVLAACWSPMPAANPLPCCTKASWLPVGQKASGSGTFKTGRWGKLTVCAVVRFDNSDPAAHAEGLPSGATTSRDAMQPHQQQDRWQGSSRSTAKVHCGGVMCRKAAAGSTAEVHHVRAPQWCAATLGSALPAGVHLAGGSAELPHHSHHPPHKVRLWPGQPPVSGFVWRKEGTCCFELSTAQHCQLLSIPHFSAGPASALFCARWSDVLSCGPKVVCQQLPTQGLAFCIVHTACCGHANISHCAAVCCRAAFRVHSNSGDKNNNAAEPPVHVSPAASLLLQNHHLVREILY